MYIERSERKRKTDCVKFYKLWISGGPKEKEETMRLVLNSDWTSSIILVKKRKPKKCILF